MEKNGIDPYIEQNGSGYTCRVGSEKLNIHFGENAYGSGYIL